MSANKASTSGAPSARSISSSSPDMENRRWYPGAWKKVCYLPGRNGPRSASSGVAYYRHVSQSGNRTVPTSLTAVFPVESTAITRYRRTVPGTPVHSPMSLISNV